MIGAREKSIDALNVVKYDEHTPTAADICSLRLIYSQSSKPPFFLKERALLLSIRLNISEAIELSGFKSYNLCSRGTTISIIVFF